MDNLYQDYAPETLKRLRRISYMMLRDFQTLCQRHSIRYFAVGGTCLGALRHGGIIPWDDDIDLGMPRKDFERFQQVAETEFPGKYSLLCCEKEPRWPFFSMRWCLKGTEFREDSLQAFPMPLGIFLDIYCWENLADDEALSRRQWIRAWFWGKLLTLREVAHPVLYARGFRRTLLSFACSIGHCVLRLAPRSFLRRRAQAWSLRFRDVETARMAQLFEPKPFLSAIRKDEVFPTRTVPFDGMTIDIPGNAEAYLTQFFGPNWSEMPPPEKRHNHPPLRLSFGPWEKVADGTAAPSAISPEGNTP